MQIGAEAYQIYSLDSMNFPRGQGFGADFEIVGAEYTPKGRWRLLAV
jgi:hypothetical protein